MLNFCERLGVSSQVEQSRGIPVMRLHIFWIEADGFLILLERVRDIPLPIEEIEGEGTVRFCQRIVEGDGFGRGGEGAWIGFGFRHRTVLADEVIAIGEAGVGFGIGGIMSDGLSEIRDSMVQVVASSSVPVVSAAQVQLLGFGILNMAEVDEVNVRTSRDSMQAERNSMEG